MDLSKSVDFLLDKAGIVIQYRLHKEILNDISKTEEENYLEKIYRLPYFKLVESYVKPNGYIGFGAHTWSNWRGVSYHETPLQDGETAARLLSCYAVPKTHPIVKGFVAAMQSDDIMREEFSYVPPAIPVFEDRLKGLNCGFSHAVIMYSMQALLGFGDNFDNLRDYQNICVKAFKRILEINSLDEITKFKPNLKRKYNRPFFECDEYFPGLYTLEMLAYSKSWRNPENIKMVSCSINRINEIMKHSNELFIRINGKYVAPAFPFIRPLVPFDGKYKADVLSYRRIYTQMAMLGVGDKVIVLRETVENIEELMQADGIMRMYFSASADKRKYINHSKYPACYSEILLEDYTSKYAFDCDLTFWAVQLLFLYNNTDIT